MTKHNMRNKRHIVRAEKMIKDYKKRNEKRRNEFLTGRPAIEDMT